MNLRYMKYLPLITCLFVLASYSVRAQAPLVAAEDLKQDMDYMVRSLEETHYNLYAFTPKEDFLENYREVRNKIGEDSLTLKEATRLLQQIAAAARNGHTEVDFPVPAYIQYAQEGGKLFPLELGVRDGKVVVTANHSGREELKPGTQITYIKNVNAKFWVEDMHRYISGESAYFRNAKMEVLSFPRLYWLYFGQPDDSIHITYNTPEGVENTLELAAIPVMEYEQNREGEVLNSSRQFSILTDSSAYLNPGPFGATAAGGVEKYKAFIDSAFQVINQTGAKRLIIDLRNHPGGDNEYSDYLIPYFADKPFKWYSDFRIKSSEILKEQTRLNNDTTAGYFRAILDHAPGETFAYPFETINPRPSEERYPGPVYVLINRQSHSMATVAAATIKDYGFGRLVGELTGEHGNLYASQFSYPLPNTGIRIKVSKGYIIRPAGEELKGSLIPDIKINSEPGAAIESILEVLDVYEVK